MVVVVTFLFFDNDDLVVDGVFDGELVKHKTSNAGVTKKILKTIGVELYKVIANKRAQTLSKKSATKDMGV